jgi:hypothetical protein
MMKVINSILEANILNSMLSHVLARDENEVQLR